MSQGAMSPAFMMTRSPGTRSDCKIFSGLPSRITSEVLGMKLLKSSNNSELADPEPI